MGHVRSSKLCRCKLFPRKTDVKLVVVRWYPTKKTKYELFHEGVKPALGKTIRGKKNDNAWKHHLIDIGVFRQPHICICHKHVHVYMYNIYIYTIYHSIYIYTYNVYQYIYIQCIYIYTHYIYIHKHIMYVYITYMWLEQKHITTAECNFIQ